MQIQLARVFLFDTVRFSFLRGGPGLAGSDLRLAFLGRTYQPDLTAQTAFADVSAHDISAGGQAITGVTLGRDGTLVEWTSDPLPCPALAEPFDHGVIYRDAGDRPLIALLEFGDFGFTDQTFDVVCVPSGEWLTGPDPETCNNAEA